MTLVLDGKKQDLTRENAIVVVDMNRFQRILLNLTGLKSSPVIVLSFAWYIVNVVIYIANGISLDPTSDNFEGFDSFEAYTAASILFTFVPHLLCMEKGKHDLLGIKFLDDAIIVIPSFLMHYVLSAVIL